MSSDGTKIMVMETARGKDLMRYITTGQEPVHVRNRTGP